MPIITKTDLTSNTSTTNATTYTTASISPGANKIVFLAVASGLFSGAPAAPSSIVGNGLTWVQVATIQNPTTNFRLTLFRAMGASPSAGTVAINFGATQEGCAWSIFELDKVATSGSNGADAVVQVVTNTATTVTSLTVTLSAFSSTDNATVGVFLSYDGPFAQTITPGSGFTQIHQQTISHDFNNAKIMTDWRDTNDTTVDATVPTFSSSWCGIALEIKGQLPTIPNKIVQLRQAVNRSRTY